jgi:hypothetical protein
MTLITDLPVGQRALLIVNCLAEHGDSRFRRLYEYIETAGIVVAKRYLRRSYGLITVIKDREATRLAFLSSMQSLLANTNFAAVDLFLELHGENDRVHFFDQWVSSDIIGRQLRQIPGNERLRLVYNTSCFGDSHSPALIYGGFKVSVGSLKVNANAATEYPAFCRLWSDHGLGRKRGLTVEKVLRRADRNLSRLVQDKITSSYFKNVDSRKIIQGDGTVSIKSNPAQ